MVEIQTPRHIRDVVGDLAVRRPPPPAVAREIRRAAGVTQAELAAIVGVTRVTVARWERGTRRPHGPKAAAYAVALRELERQVTK